MDIEPHFAGRQIRAVITSLQSSSALAQDLGEEAVRRRDFITLLGGAAVAGSVGARAQQAGMPVIGFLHSASPDAYVSQLKAFHQALKEIGFVEGQNVAIEYRWAENQIDRLSALAGDLVRRKVLVIAAGGSPASALAAKSATTTIPIVFMNAADPVRIGLVASFNRAGRKRNRRYLAQCRTSGKAAGNPS